MNRLKNLISTFAILLIVIPIVCSIAGRIPFLKIEGTGFSTDDIFIGFFGAIWAIVMIVAIVSTKVLYVWLAGIVGLFIGGLFGTITFLVDPDIHFGYILAFTGSAGFGTTFGMFVGIHRTTSFEPFDKFFLYILPITWLSLVFINTTFPSDTGKGPLIGLATTVVACLIMLVTGTIGYYLRKQSFAIIKFFKEKSFPGTNLLRTFNKEVIVFIAIYSFEIIFFASCYFTVNLLSPDSFSSGVQLSRWDALYFSVITITTLGYGDIAPVSDLTKALTVIEVLLGVFTLAIYFSFLIVGLVRSFERRDTEQRGR